MKDETKITTTLLSLLEKLCTKLDRMYNAKKVTKETRKLHKEIRNKRLKLIKMIEIQNVLAVQCESSKAT